MAHAIVTAVAVEITCPECDEGITAPNGSYMWTAQEYGEKAGGRIQCGSCGTLVRVPKLTRVSI